jgi:HAE1 family hydrophobic/amphiphilic exporter-1
LGCVPLALASGAGAISRRVMGTAVIGGMGAASAIAIFLIPVTFYVVEKLGHRGNTGAHPEPGGQSSPVGSPPEESSTGKEGSHHA